MNTPALRGRSRSLVLPVDCGGHRSILRVLVPVGQDRRNLGRVGELVHVLKVLLCDGKRLRGHVGDVLANELGGVDRRLVDLLEKERPERLDTRPQERRVERHVDAAQGNRCKPTLELQRRRLLQRSLGAALDDLLERPLGLVDVAAHLLNIDLLLLEEVGNTRQGVKSAQVTGSNILHVGNVVVDNLEQPARLLRDAVNNKLQSLLVERLGDSARVDGAHRVVGSAGRVALDGDLHRQPTVEDNRHQTLNRHDLRQGRESRVFTQRVTGKGAVSGHETLGLHILKAGLLHEREGGLRKLCRRQQPGGRAVLVGAVPDFPSDFTAGVKLHTHALLLGALAGEDVGGHGLFDLGLAEKNLLLGLLVAGLDLDDLATRNHANVLKLDLEVVVGEDHADQGGVEAADTANVVLGGPRLDKTADSSAGVHAVGNGTGEGGIVGKDADTSVVLVGGGGTELERGAAAERDGVLKVQRLVERGPVALEVVDHGVAVRLAGLVVDAGDLDDLLGGQLKKNLALRRDAAIHRLGLVAVEALETEGECLSEKVEVARQVISVEPLLRLKNSNVLAGGQVQLDRGLHLALECVLIVGVSTAVQELRRDVHDGLTIAVDGAADLHHLARLLVDDSIDLCGGRDLVTLLEGLGTGLHAELVRQVHQLQQVTVNGAREDGLGNGLPANNDGEVHGGVNSLARTLDEGLASVANGVNKVVDVLAGDGSLATIELAANIGIQVKLFVAEPCTPVELLDAVVAALHDLADGSVASLGVIGELEGKGNGLAEGGGVLDHVDDNVVLALELDLNDINVLVVARLFLDDDLGLLGVLGVLDLDKEATGRGKDTLDRVGLELLTLDNNLGGEEGVAPAAVGPSKQSQPRVEAWQSSRGRGRQTTVNVLDGNVRLDQLTTKVLNSGDGLLVTLVEIPGQVLNVGEVNAIEDVLDRLVNDLRELDSGRSLQNTGTSDILTDDGTEVLGLPKRILLEVEVKVLIESGDKGDGLLNGTQTQHQEVLDILGVDELRLSVGVVGQDLLDSLVRRLKVLEILKLSDLAGCGGEALLNAADEVAGESDESRIDPALLVTDVEQVNHAANNLTVGHVLQVDGLAGAVATEPNLLEVIVQLLDDVVTVLLQLRDTLLLGEGEDLLVHLGPEQDTTSRELVDGLAHLGENSDDTTRRASIGLLPLAVINTGGVDDGLLGSRAGLGLLGNHHAATKQGVGVLGTTETTAGNKNDVCLTTDTGVHGEDRLVEVLVRVVATATTTSPLQNDREGRVGLGNVDDGLDRIHGTGLEADVLQAKRVDVLLGDLDGGNTGTNSQALDGHTLGSESSEHGDLPLHGARVDVNEVYTNTTTGRDRALDLLQSSSHHAWVKVTATSQLNVVASVHSSSNEIPGDSAGCHAGDDNGGKTQQSAHLGVDIGVAVGVGHQTRAKLLDPVDGILDSVLLITVKELGLVSNLGDGAVDGASKDDVNTSTLLVAAGENTQAGNATGAEVEDVSRLGKNGSLLPVDRVSSDKTDDGGDDVAVARLTKVLSGVRVEHGSAQSLGGDFDVLEILVNQLGRLSKVLAVERRGDGQEAVDKAELALGVRNTVLVQAGRRLDLAELGIQTVQGDWGASNNEVARAVDERNGDVAVGGEVLVGGIDMLLNLGLRKVPNAKHGCGKTFAIVHGLSQHGGCQRRAGEDLLTASTDPEEDGESRGRKLLPRLPRLGGGRDSGKDDALGVTGRSADLVAEQTGVNAEDLAGDLVVSELDKTNQGEADRRRNKVVDVGGLVLALEPSHDVQAFGVELLRLGVLGECLKELGGIKDELANEGLVCLVDLAQLVEVLFDVALTAKDGVNIGGAIIGSAEER
ncbi:hypothetical protein CTA1_24 [Colletotrichum tanaceti]|uniref:Uncharacterized protein n=1 Tax=Colletotrichum tanaceti TaxID=1306861 RepID=A0A4U6XG62_9PEZI|nr:hypothetical protein CTA1_24 [Colletotrichum tanaceti]